MISAAGCVGGYALCAFAPQSAAWLGLVGCGIVGFCVSIMWPGTLSFASATIPKGASVAEYHTATALEALFGWLYLRGETVRLNELFTMMMEE